MAVTRIVANIATADVAAVRDFYADLFGLNTVMDFGWIATLATGTSAPVQISIASEGGAGTEVPDLSIEVDDVDVVHDQASAQGHQILYGPVDEPWGVRRFYIRDPAGRLLNVLAHIG